ncbi:MAG TPA: prolipoprotein diacylglyceryl transferase [Anaerolineaceae bacterium]|nr:prolipoprotein diacylglyceryl transferase [Anaerolineaceae bacterium]
MLTVDREGLLIAPDLLLGILLALYAAGILFTSVLPYLRERRKNPAARFNIDWVVTLITLAVIIAGRFAFEKAGVEHLNIRFYGLIIMSGVVGAAVLASKRAPRFGQNPEVVWDMILWLLIGGVLGARLWHVLTPPPSMVEAGITTRWYFQHPLDMLMIWRGGLGIVGGVVGGFLALLIYTRIKRISLLSWTDIIAPGLLLAQAVGRWGNFINQELYGAPTNLPWKIYIEPLHRLPEYAGVEYYHPLFLYESLWNLLSMGILFWLEKRFKHVFKPGDSFFIYLILYPITRFTLEFLRLDASLLAGINANQWLMVLVMAFAVVMLIVRHRKVTPPAEMQVQ